MISLNLPLNKSDVKNLKAGDYVLLTGSFLTGRDAAHKRLYECIVNKQTLPCSIKDQTIYYVGPCFNKEGIVTSAGPTTSGRMDKYAPALLNNGLIGMIGKGNRSKEVVDAIIANCGIYFAAIGGAGAVYANAITESKAVTYEDLGTEAIYKFTIKDFPVIVAIDAKGNTIY